jgi:hypothetical protein
VRAVGRFVAPLSRARFVGRISPVAGLAVGRVAGRIVRLPLHGELDVVLAAGTDQFRV